ncbi:MAG: TolC family protein [Candidatus Acidiferrales bacterium]
MKKNLNFSVQSKVIGAVAACAISLFAGRAAAQAGPGGGSSQGTQAVQLPLSGRGGAGGSVNSAETPVPGTTTSVNTLNPNVQVQGPYTGSASSVSKMPFSGRLSFQEAIQRGLTYNLGAIGLAEMVRQADGMRQVSRSSLLPNLNGSFNENYLTENLRALGVHFNVPGFNFPTLVGPFNYFDARAKLTQSVLDLTAINNYRAAREVQHSDELSALDARDMVVLAVGGTYLQVIAAKARVASARAQLQTADALYQQAVQQRAVGLIAQVDVNRSQVQSLTEQQRLLSLEDDLAKQKIDLARLTGLPPTNQYEISDDVPLPAAPTIELDAALKTAFAQRPDLKAAESQLRASELARAAARSELLPSVSVSADYGDIGLNPAQGYGTYTINGSVKIPLWQGGRAKGDIQEADAALAQRRAELEDLKSLVESQVRKAFLDLQASESQVEVARKNEQVSRETLDLTKQRFEAGVADSVEVVQSEQTVASAELDYINSVFGLNLAKLSLARAMGGAAENLSQLINKP